MEKKIPLEHPLNAKLNKVFASTSNLLEVDKGGTWEEESGSTKVDEDEESREFANYMTRQARTKTKGGTKVRGPSSRKPSGI